MIKKVAERIKGLFILLSNEFNLYIFNRFAVFINNPKLLVWLIVNSSLFWLSIYNRNNFYESLIITEVIYFLMINIAVSNTVEKILRFLEDVRHIATRTEKERLIPLFEDVYHNIVLKNKYISRNIKLYIVDEISINAFCLGRNTIVVTRGLMEVMNDEEIKGILAHELGHMVKNDSLVNILLAIGTTFYLWIGLMLCGILTFIENLAYKHRVVVFIVSLINKIFEIIIRVALFIWIALISNDSRKNEYRADMFASKMGYGQQLISALYKLYDIQISDKKDLIESIQATHPKIAFRIEKLEEMN